MSTITLSVVTPAYNQAAFLRDTIESVLSQAYPHIEHRVIDDGSTDDTPRILEEYTGKILWERQANQGQTPTINRGWELATGDVLTWLNSDDTFLPGAVPAAMAYLEAHPEVDIVYGDTLFTHPDGSPIRRHHSRPFHYEHFVVECHNPIPQPSAFIRRRVVENVGLLDPYYYYFMDWDFWLRAGARHVIRYVPELWSTYRLHAESKTVSQARRAAPELERMYREHFHRPDLPGEVARRRRRAFAGMFFNTGGYYIQGDSPREAALSGLRAVKAYPELLFQPRLLHKLLFCLFGGTQVYQRSRAAYHRLRPAPAH